MRMLDQLLMKFRMAFARGKAASQLDDELRFHLDRQIAENLAAGMEPEEARTAALRAFGNPALLRDQTRTTWSWTWLESLLRDVHYGARGLMRAPGFAAIAILVMALGIGANVALFTIVRSVLLKPLPYRDPDKLVSLFEADTKINDNAYHAYLPVAAGSFFEWQKATRGEAEMALISPWQDYNVSAEGGKLPERIDAAWCSWNAFKLLGVQPALGRTFTPEDDRPDAPATVILASSFWKMRYGGDPKIVGRTIWLDARPYTVIGVLGSSFFYTSSMGGSTVKAWTPVEHEAAPSLLSTFGDHEFMVIARLLNGTTLASLTSQLKGVQRQIHIDHAEPSVHDSAMSRTMLDDVVHMYRTPLYAMLAATGCVLLIACMNVASLLIARTAARSKELAIRAALGGGRMRLLRERLVESLLLSTVGGAFGLLFAWGALQWLVQIRQDMNRAEAIQIDSVVALFTIGIIALCALFSGLVAAFSSRRKAHLPHAAGVVTLSQRRQPHAQDCARSCSFLKSGSQSCFSLAPACCLRASNDSAPQISACPLTMCSLCR